MKINRQLMEESSHWMLGADANGRRLAEWADSRNVDLDALAKFAYEEAEQALEEVLEGECSLRTAVRTLAIQIFITDLEAERCRRDKADLPGLS